MNTSVHLRNIVEILHGKPAADISALPAIWQHVTQSDHVVAARLFRYHHTNMGIEALNAIGHDLQRSAYPDLDRLLDTEANEKTRRTLLCLKDLFSEFGYDVPASFYNALLGALDEENETVGRRLFKYKSSLMQDRLWDAVLHAMLLVTPLGLYVHSVFSQHGLRFVHMMNCSCKIEPREDELPFHISLDQALKPAYLQNLVAAALEQYGVNASTSGKTRGF